MFDFVVAFFDLLSLLFQALYNFGHGLVNAALYVKRVGTGGYVFHAFGQDGLGEDRCGGRTVAGVVTGLAGYALDELCAGVLESVVEFNFLGYGDAVLRDARGAEFLVDNYVATFRAEGYFDCVGQHVGTFLEELAGFGIVFQFFCHDCLLSCAGCGGSAAGCLKLELKFGVSVN